MTVFSFHKVSSNRYNWMSRVADDTLLSSMSIPGTHDSMTATSSEDNSCYNPLYKRCCVTQSMSLRDQLYAGIRFIDIRLKHEYNNFTLHHDFISLGVTLSDVLRILIEFLNTNPSEAVIMSYQEEQKGEANNGVSFAIDFAKQFRDIPNEYIYSKSIMPTLGETRGKIVLLDWSYVGKMGLVKNNDYVENWWDDIVYWYWFVWFVKHEYYEKLKSNIIASQFHNRPKNLYVSYFSANDCQQTLLNYGPRKIASYVNPKMSLFIRSRKGKGSYGVIVMDFPSIGIIDEIISNNLVSKIR